MFIIGAAPFINWHTNYELIVGAAQFIKWCKFIVGAQYSDTTQSEIM